MTQYLDLDALVNVEKTVRFKGKEHKLKHVSVQDFVDNVKLAQSLGPDAGIEKEVEATITMLLKAFPTMDRADLMDVPLEALNKILAFAQANDGSDAVKGAAEADAKANPPTAG